MNDPKAEWKCSLTIRKHIPSGRQYTPADEISATVRWDDGEGVSWQDRFQGLNEATAQAVREWLNPSFQASVLTSPRLDPGEKPVIPKFPNEASLDQLPWKPYRDGHSSGWIFGNLYNAVAKQLTAYLEAQPKLPVIIGRYRYRFSGPKDDTRKFVSRSPVEKQEHAAETLTKQEQEKV